MLVTLIAVLIAIAAGIPLSIWATAALRRNRKAAVMASGLFFAFAAYNREPEKIAEAREEGDHASRQTSGDPPEP